MDPATCLYYLRVSLGRTISVPVFSRLLKEYGSTAAISKLPAATLDSLGFDERQVQYLENPAIDTESERAVEAALEWSSRRGNHLLCYESGQYPQLLREIDTAPPVLFVRGSLELLNARQLSIVGSRRASMYGKRNAFWMAQALCLAGLNVSSGLASGIDTRAHEGALASDGKTIAVIGTGIDRVYPRRNHSLFERIAELGAVVSEFPLGTPPYAGNFPRRNRILSGMSAGTLVIEANIKSGSLITARLAMEQNRDVFALPGPIGSVNSRGCHQLIKQGAKLVEEPTDILEEFDIEQPDRRSRESANNTGQSTPQAIGADEARILRAIDQQGCLFQAIVDECQLGAQQLNTSLIQLEAAGLISQSGGRYYRLDR